MTDRVKGCWVAFDKDIRVDDVEPIIEAIKMLRCVQDVTLEKVNMSDFTAHSRIKSEYLHKILDLFKEPNL